MTLDEAIELYEERSKDTWNGHQTREGKVCRQMADWLKELKERREKWEELVEEIQELKRRCNNPTCYEAYETGYYSALSFVEQIISKLEVIEE